MNNTHYLSTLPIASVVFRTPRHLELGQALAEALRMRRMGVHRVYARYGFLSQGVPARD